MPYIITTRMTRFRKAKRPPFSESHFAVATLFEAAEEAAHRIEQITGGDPDYEEVYTDAQGCSELGETFGPLQDGTVIEVEQSHWEDLRAKAGLPATVDPAISDNQTRILDTYNSKEQK